MRFSDDTIVWSRYLEDRIRGLEDLVSNVLEERAWVAVVSTFFLAYTHFSL